MDHWYSPINRKFALSPILLERKRKEPLAFPVMRKRILQLWTDQALREG